MDGKNIQRRYDLDWLRVLAIMAIFVFHTTRLFDPYGWSVKNPSTYVFVGVWNAFATIWGMPLILIISGASAFYALGKVRPGKYILGLLARLLLPLIVGIFTHVAFQVYLENLQKGTFSGSFFDFYPHYFDGMYGFGGNFAWMGLHLWYLEILFILSLLFLPLFAWFKYSTLGQRVLKGVGVLLAKPGALFLFALPVILLINTLDPATWGMRDMGGWSIFIYPCFFIAGFVIVSGERLQARIGQMRWLCLGLGAALSTAYLFWRFDDNLPKFYLFGGSLKDLFLVLSCWCWLLAVFGFGMKHLNFNTPFLKYANEAVLPFYILHQTVIVSLGYFVVQWAIPDLLKWLIIVPISFAAIMVLYEFVVRRFNVMRVLFGMKPLKQAAPVTALSAQPLPAE
jgi:peptidoglycan/LPS O-acetylase OafA/YrhL